MNCAGIKYHAVEDGPGCRTVLFVSGCRHHCKGCFQPQTWDFDYGVPFDDGIEETILKSLSDEYTTGLTLLGGEPFEPENQKALLPFLKKVRSEYPDKSIWAYSGFTFEDLIGQNKTNETIPILNMIDVLVDGPFIEEKRNLMLPFRGSENQRILNIPESLVANKAVIYEKYHNRQR